MLSFEMGRAAAWHYLRGTWLGRIAMLTWLWPVLIVMTLQGQESHATGLRWLLIVIDLIGCAIIAWVVASFPAYLRAAAVRRSTGSRAHPALAIEASEVVPGSLRLSR